MVAVPNASDSTETFVPGYPTFFDYVKIPPTPTPISMEMPVEHQVSWSGEILKYEEYVPPAEERIQVAPELATTQVPYPCPIRGTHPDACGTVRVTAEAPVLVSEVYLRDADDHVLYEWPVADARLWVGAEIRSTVPSM